MFVFLIGSFSLPVTTGQAQEPSPSATADGTVETPTATLETIETETAVPAAPSEVESIHESQQARSSDSLIRILITISPNARISRVRTRVNDLGEVSEMPELSKLGVFMMDVPAGQAAEIISQLQTVTGVLYVEPDYPVQAADTYPNDPGLANQYALAAIRAPQGWDLSTGSSSITIAILDSGVDLGHVDLVSKLVAGYDFVNSDSTPQDDYGHGTHVAGIAAASGNNGAGIAGVSWGARIMPVKVLNASGGGSYSNVAAGIVWAVDHGAQVINMSLGGAGNPDAVTNPSALRLAVLYAYNNNVLMVASSGNTGSAFVLYPARYNEVMAVGASNISNQPANFSNYGPEVDIAAPGENIYSLWPGGYLIQTGTSMSAPHVSGLAAILYGYVNSAASVRNVIESTALDIFPVGWDLYSGAGLIQMDAALALVIPPTPTPTFTSTSLMGGNGGFANLPGYLLSSSPTWTPSRTPFDPAHDKPVATTQTVSPLREADKSTPTWTPTPTQPPLRVDKLQRLKIFFSPYFCGAALMILLGLWLFRQGGSYVRRKR